MLACAAAATPAPRTRQIPAGCLFAEFMMLLCLRRSVTAGILMSPSILWAQPVAATRTTTLEELVAERDAV